MIATSYANLDARARATALADPGTFSARPGFPVDVSVAVGSGRVGGREVVFALSDGRRHGGTFGVREATLLDVVLGEILDAHEARGGAPALILGLDTGGVRVEEGPGALAAVSAVGVALARLVSNGVAAVTVISGPRGCFGAPSVMAALPPAVIMTEDAHWGLTGPRLIEQVRSTSAAGEAASTARSRHANGDATAVVADEPAAVRAALVDALDRSASAAGRDPLAIIEGSRARCAALAQRLHAAESFHPQRVRTARERDFLRYSFRGQWTPEGAVRRTPLLHASLGRIGDRPALGLVVGPEQAEGIGVGIDEAALVTEMLAVVAAQSGPPAVIMTFVFCQGHVVDFAQERYGLPTALAECLRALVAARLRGHPIVTTLGGGTYGAAYLAFAAPSHRVLALRGTTVAPMAPDVLRAFQELRGRKPGQESAAQLAELIPAVRTVESVIRLPRILREEIHEILAIL